MLIDGRDAFINRLVRCDASLLWFTPAYLYPNVLWHVFYESYGCLVRGIDQVSLGMNNAAQLQTSRS